MDPQLQDAGKPAQRWKHDWYSYEQYRVVHESYMERLRREALVLRDFISFRESEDAAGELAAVHLRGVVTCSDGILVRVDKKMLVRRDDQNRYEVKTQFYQYHAMTAGRAGRPRRNLVRYDNAHGQGLHRHLFDESGVDIATLFIDLDDMPTLDEFVRLAIAIARGEQR